MRKFKFIDTKFHPKIDSPLHKFKEINGHIDHPNLLTPLQHVYFTKLSNLAELINHLHLYNGTWIFPPGRTPPWKTTV